MRKVIVMAVALLAAPTLAADKGKPNATLDQIMAAEAKAGSCHVESSALGTFLRADREAQLGIGGGCDAILSNLVIGAGIRNDLANSGVHTGSIFGKLGIAINNGAIIYGLAEWRVPEWKIKDAGQFGIGAGAELRLDIINAGLWGFVEGTFAASKFGLATKDDVSTRVGLRYKF